MVAQQEYISLKKHNTRARRVHLSQQPDGTIIRAEQQKPPGGQYGKTGERTTKVLCAEFGGSCQAGCVVQNGVYSNLVGNSACHDLSTVKIKRMNGVGWGSVLVQWLVLHIFPNGQCVI